MNHSTIAVAQGFDLMFHNSPKDHVHKEALQGGVPAASVSSEAELKANLLLYKIITGNRKKMSQKIRTELEITLTASTLVLACRARFL